MSDPITDRVVQILTHNPETFVPLEQLYDALVNEGLMAWTDLGTFARLLEVDERFDLIMELAQLIIFEVPLPAELGPLGMPGGPWVMLSSRRDSPQQLLRDLLSHLHRMNMTMEQAWVKFSDDPRVRANLIGLLMLGDMLERQVQGALKTAAGEGYDEELPAAALHFGTEAQSS
jgi:hypothetical protein